MNLPLYQDYFPSSHPRLALSTGAAGVFPAQTVSVELDRNNPLDEIQIIIRGTCGAAASGTTGANLIADLMYGLVKRVYLDVNDGGTPRRVVDCSGAYLVEMQYNEQGSLDVDTIFASNQGRSNASSFEMTFSIPLAMPQLPDPLRSFTLLPVHRHRNNPVLSIDFASRGEMDTGGTPALTLTALSCEVVHYRRIITPEFDAQVDKLGGWWNYDILEKEDLITATGEYNLEMAGGGLYTGYLIRTYNSLIDRTSVATNTYLQFSTTQADSVFRIKQGTNVVRNFRLGHLVKDNARSRTETGLAYNLSANAPCFRPMGSFYLDFLTSAPGIDGSKVSQFGSCLLVNPAQAGQRTYLNTPSYVGGSNIKIRHGGRRFSLDVLNQMKVAAGA